MTKSSRKATRTRSPESQVTVQFLLNDAQVGLQLRLRDAVTERVAEGEVGRRTQTAEDASRREWQTLLVQSGLAGIVSSDGNEGCLVSLAAASEVLGETLYDGPSLPTLLVAQLASSLSTVASRWDELPRVLGGEAVAAVAFGEGGATLPPRPASRLRRVGGRKAMVTGYEECVIDGNIADWFFVLAADDDRIALAVVNSAAVGLSRRLTPTLDQTRKQAEVMFADAPAEVIAGPAELSQYWPTWFQRAQVLAAAELVGVGSRSLQLAVDYARTRVQFGRPIGSLQSIKHLCADLYAEIESARSSVYYAAWVADNRPDELPAMATLAKLVSSQASYRAAAGCLQIFGGRCFTWDAPPHLYLKRAKSMQLLFGDPGRCQRQLSHLLAL
jgi:alkylation response protein AidB-like acyl-CoA dehydrogenase